MNSEINCVVDTPILQELYNKVKNKVESYKEFKALVSLWWKREKQKNPQFDYEVYPSPEEIDSLLSERTNKKEEEMGLTISYTPKGKRTQVYTIKGSHIYNRDGKEVFAKDSIDRNKIFANLAVKSGRAVVVEHNNSRYVVNNRNQIISVTTGKIMQWDEKNGDRNAIIKAAQEKFNRNKPSESIQKPTSFNWGRTSDNNYEVSSAGDSRFSAFDAKLKPGTKILGVTVPEEKSTFIAEKPTTTNSIEYVFQTLIKKSGKGQAPSKDSKLYMPYNYKDSVPFIRQLALLGRFAIPSNNLEEVRKADSKRGDISKITKKSKSYTILQSLLEFNKFADIDVSQLDVSEATKDRIKEAQRKFKNTTAYDSVSTTRVTEDEAKIRATEFRDMYSIYTPLIQDIVREVWGVELSTSPITFSALDLTPSGKSELLQSKEEKEDFSYYVGYLPLWQEWAKQNPELIEELRTKAAGKTLTDQFAYTRVSQARALADILNSTSSRSKTTEEVPNISEYINIEGANKGFLTKKGEELLGTTFNKDEFNTGTVSVKLYPGVKGTTIEIGFISPKTGHKFYVLYNGNPTRKVWDLLNSEQQNVTNVNDEKYWKAIDTIVPKSLRDLVESGKYNEMDSTARKTDDKTFVVTETELENYFEEKYNVFKQGRSTEYNTNQINKALNTKSEAYIPSVSSYTGNITPDANTIFVFGSNPEGRHGAGAAKIAREQFGAIYGQGEGLQGNAYALPTKDLRVKENNSLRSISPEQIIESIKKLYETARQNPDKQFKVAYRNTDKASLNGYTGLEMIDMFLKAGPIPSNIVFSKEWVDTGKFNLADILNSTNTKSETVEEAPIFEDNETSIQDSYSLASGDAVGSDAAWTSAAREAGIKNTRNFSTKSYDALSEEEKKEADSEYLKAATELSRPALSNTTYKGKLVRRNWLQVKNSDAVFAIGSIVNSLERGKSGLNYSKHAVVDGGTGYAVQMAINNNKPVHVFDQDKGKWFTWKDGNFVEEPSPVLTKRFAGIGTRQINDSGKAAIKEIFSRTFNLQQENGAIVNNFVPFSEEIEELSLEERGLTPAINPNDLEAKADVAFGTPQRRRDRVNLIANAIRQNFSIEFERQKRALQERISSETDADKIVELQEQLDTLDEKRAVELGLNNILARIKKMFQPKDSLPAYYNSEFVKLQDNWDTVVAEALELLKETDGLAVDFIETNFDDETQIDEESGDYYNDDSQKEYGYKDGWMIKARFVSQRDSLSKKVRKIIWTTDKIGFDGKPEIDDLGFKRYLQPDMVQATLLQACGQARNSEHFWKILDDLAKRKKWVQPLIDRLNKEEDTKSQFYQNFRKEFMPYWVQLQKEVKNTDGEVISVVTQTKRVNKIPGIMHMLDEWRDNYEEGSKLDEFSVYKEGQQLDKENASKAFDYISELQNSYPEDVNEWIESDDNLNKVMRVLHMAGITADAEVVREALKGEDLQDGTQRLDKIYQLLSGMFRDIKDDKIGKTVSSDGTIQYDDLLNAYDSAYTVIARIIDTIPEDSILSSFREAGNSYQSYSAPSYLGKLINNLKNLEGTAESLNKFYQEQYGQYKWFYSKNTGYRSSWLRQLVSSQSKRDLLDRKIILHSGKLEFNDWGNSEYAKVMISEFLSTADNNSAWYYLPLLADAESAEFIKFTKYTNSSVQDESGNYIPYDRIILSELEDVVRQEYDRIMLVRQREGKVNPIANFDIIRDKNGEEIGVVRNADGDIISRNTGNEFKFFPELNTYKINGRLFIDVLQEKILRNDSDVSSFIQSALSDIMESGFTKFMKTMDEAGVLETTNGVSKYFQINASELEETLRNFYWNNALAQTQLIELTTTDIAYYKDMRDFQKRFKEVYAQTLKLNTEATFNGEKVGRQTGRVAYLKDLKMVAPSKEALKQMLEGRVEAGAISELDKDAILNHFNNVNVADAQAYRTLDSYRRVLVMSGRWTQTDEDAMNRLKNGTWSIKDFNTIWQTIKPFMYTQGPRPSGVADYGNIKVPSQYKNSEFLLLAMYNTIATPLQDSSVLRAINEFMEENDIDMVMFESAVKAGNQAPIKIDINMSLPDIKNLLNSKIKNSDGSENAEVIHEFDYEDYGIQVETPEHMVDKYQLFGTQIRKLISSDMSDKIEISLFGSKKKYSKAEWWTMYNSLITANVVDSYNEVAKEFSSIEHVAEIIQSELKGNTRYSDEIKKACELIEVTNPLTGETEKVFNLPLYDPVQSERVQHLLNSIIKKKVVKQTIKGGTGIQVSAYGLTDKLSIVWEGEGKNRRMKYMECFLPAYSKEFFEPLMKFKTVNGEQVGYLDINELPEELRRIIGYRIPTEDKYSMAPLYIKGFLPQENGSMIMLPAEITELTGSDFDVDKFYLMFPEFYVQKFNYSKAKEDFQRLNKITDEVASWFKNSDLKEAFDEAPQSFKEWFEDNKESYRYDKPRIIYYRYDYSKSARENSVQQRNNQLINMIWGVLTNQDTVEKQLNPGNFEKAKIAARICSIANNADSKKLMSLLGITDKKLIYDTLSKLSLDELDSISSSFIGVLSPISPTTQLFFHSQNATGGKMIGIYANNNASHAIVQHTKLSCVPFTIDGHEYKSLHSIKNEKGNYITRNISNFLAASVDNVKDPVLKDLMQDTITGDLSCFMLRAGVEPNEVGLFMNQPIVKKIIEALRENEFGDRKAIINSVIDSWAKQRQWKTSKEDAERYKNLYSEDLFNAILFEKDMQRTFDENATKGEKGWFNFQLYVGNAFKNMYATSNDLSELTAIMRADTSNGSAGPSNADTYNKINRILRFQERMQSDRFNLINADLISFSYPKEGEDIYDLCMNTTLPFLNAFTIAGIGGTMVLMKKYFPHFNSSIYNMLFDPEFGLTTYLKEGRTNTKFINTVLNDLLVYVMSKTQFFNSYIDNVGNVHTGIENRKRFIINFPNEFIKTVNENPDIAENRFVSRIRLKYPKRGVNGKLPIASLVFRNSGKLSTIQRDMYSRDWLSLLYSPNPKAVELGLNLFKYASFMGGFGFGPNSFIHMAPVLLRKAIPGYEQTLRNLVKKDDYFPFIRQFILNHMDMPNLVPQYAEKDLSGITYSNYDRNFEATPNNSSFVKEQMTTTDESKNMVLMNKLIPFISIIKPNGELTYFEADSWYVADGQPIRYHKVSPLGFKGKVLEYEYGKSNFDSVFYKVQRLKEDMVSTAFEDEEDGLPSKEIAPYDSMEQVETPIPEGFDVSFKQNIENYEATPVEDANGQISCGGFDLEGSPLVKL